MSNLPIQVRPLEQLLIDGKISIWYMGYKKVGEDEVGQPVYDYNIGNWGASVIKPKRAEAEGPTPRDAVINLLKKIGAI